MSETRVCIVGAGAIGGFIGTRLAAAGRARVSALARGATLAALREHGWRLRMGGQLIQAHAIASDEPAALGPQDLVIIAVKGQALGEVAARIAPLLAPHTRVLPAMNGVPWWFGAAVPALADAPLDSVDPGGRIARAIPLAQVLGCVVHASTAQPEPGLVQHAMGQGLIVGEPAGGSSGRAQQTVDLLAHAGFEATLSTDIRSALWYKLWGNLTMNPVSALTGATIDRVLADPLVRDFCSAAMAEAQTIGARIACPIDQTPEDRHAVTARLGAFRTSMLQDADAGRPIELDAIVGAVREIGLRLAIPTPHVDALLGLTRLFGRVQGLYPEVLRATQPDTGIGLSTCSLPAVAGPECNISPSSKVRR
ncbi:2-dehydropantoate 2-reductase [Pseudaquabacterium rugosum]|uniref:2-dehydropantoate 2-reductase n=1 Tax=Pseudaquabacterium rugosum TaxID=2984194 RepID=A0ABU9B876_9BURK